MLQPRLPRCPQLLLLLVSPPPRPAAACRQWATSSSRGLRSALAVSSAPGAPTRGLSRLAAAVREEQWGQVAGDEDGGGADLGEALTRTRELVECAMFAAVAGLAYFLSNSLAIENYFSCFFPLPIVISSLRWGLEAGRKTLVATVLLLFTLSGPVKASTYLLMHGVVGLIMGTIWRLEANWIVSILLCSISYSGINLQFHIQQQQQQQRSLLSQASWGSLEMKPKRDMETKDT